MKRQKDDTYYPEAATEAIKRMNESARKNGTSEMTLDEINAEIAACRKERRQSKRSTDILGGDMTPDMCVPCGDGLLNIRVGALIVKNGKILMVQSSHAEELMLLNCGVGKRLLRVPWTARRSKQSILGESSPEYSLEGLMLKLKLQHFGHLITANSLEKTLMLGNIDRRKRRG